MERKRSLERTALIVSIISLCTCSLGFILGVAGVIMSLIILTDKTGKYPDKKKGIIAFVLSIASLIIMIIIISSSGVTEDNTTEETTVIEETVENEETDVEEPKEIEISRTEEKTKKDASMQNSV